MESETSLLAFSINIKDANKEFIYPAIDQFLAANNHRNKLILVGDTIREGSYIKVDGYSKQKARQICIEIGNQFIKVIKEYFQEKSIDLVTIIRWDDLMVEKEYKDLMSAVISLVKKKANLMR